MNKFKYYFRIETRTGIETNEVIFTLDEIQKREFTGKDLDIIAKCQFTGFKDNKGNEIYDGHILSDWTETDEGLVQSKRQVFWCPKTGAWKLDNSFNQDKSSGDLLSEELADYSYEITGHIFK